MSYSSHQQQLNENINRQNQYFQKIEQFIEQLQQKCIEMCKINEKQALRNYKNDLQKTKVEFTHLKQQRNQQIIEKKILTEKKSLEKQCAISVKKSLQIAKVYENFNKKWKEMHSYQHQMNLQKTFLEKQIQKASKLSEKLEKQIQNFNEEIQRRLIDQKNRKPALLCPLPTRSDVILEKSVNNLNLSKKQVSQTTIGKKQPTVKTMQLKSNTQNRLKQRIKAKKVYLNSINVNLSPFQQIFNGYHLKDYEDNKQKIKLIEKIFNENSTKQYLYKLLFEVHEQHQSDIISQNKENIKSNEKLLPVKKSIK